MILLAGVADKVFSLVKDTVEAQGVGLWDVRFVKEGANWYLRIIIDSENGISIDDCTNVHHAVDPILDEADPIDRAYYLEVCSPGLERELTRDEHYAAMEGQKVKLKLYKAKDGVKEFGGELKLGDKEKVVLKTENGEIEFARNEISYCRLDDINF
ncbi:MAG: ribosome maturation factor RimP [Clostridia bacterium]|nr:ribosome maturation factor RimP [Clostridia bacterium]